MTKILATLAAGMVFGLSSGAFAQDATTTPTSPSDTSSPLTPSPSGSPLTPSPTTSPTSGATQPPTTADTMQSSSETPATSVQSPVEANRIDPSAPSNLSIQIDPNSANSSVLNADSSSSLTAPGLTKCRLARTEPAPARFASRLLLMRSFEAGKPRAEIEIVTRREIGRSQRFRLKSVEINDSNWREFVKTLAIVAVACTVIAGNATAQQMQGHGGWWLGPGRRRPWRLGSGHRRLRGYSVAKPHGRRKHSPWLRSLP